jgi:hypothetical protein
MRITSIIILILIAAVAFAGDNAPWVDMKSCPICMNVSSEEGLMEGMTWEHHLTATGVIIVSTIKPEFQHKFDRAKSAMKELLGKVVSGEKIQVCGYCSSLSSLLKEGAKAENIITKSSDIMLISSTDEKMIARIHTHTQKTIDFLSDAHKGHNH